MPVGNFRHRGPVLGEQEVSSLKKMTMKIRDMMTTDVELVHPDTLLQDAAQKCATPIPASCRSARMTA